MLQTVLENLGSADGYWQFMSLFGSTIVVEILGYPDLLIPNGNGPLMTLFVQILKFLIKLGSIVEHLNCRDLICATGLRSVITEMMEALFKETECVPIRLIFPLTNFSILMKYEFVSNLRIPIKLKHVFLVFTEKRNCVSQTEKYWI